MNILITGASAAIARRLASALGDRHAVTLTDRAAVDGVENFVRCDLDHDDATSDLVRGMDVIIHSGRSERGGSVSERLDDAMRCLYNLVRAACEEGTPRLIFLSSLAVMGRHDERHAVTECWRPAPTTDTETLGFHMGEFICREFAREHRIEVVCLRLGELTWNSGEAPPSDGLYVEDAVHAVERALSADISEGYADSRSYWGLFHIQSSVPNQRFLTTAARTALGYTLSAR